MRTFFLPRQRFAGLQMGLQEESMPELAAHWQECCNQLQDFVCLLQTKKRKLKINTMNALFP